MKCSYHNFDELARIDSHPYAFYVQKLHRGFWKTVGVFYCLEVADLVAKDYAATELNPYRVLRIDIANVAYYDYKR